MAIKFCTDCGKKVEYKFSPPKFCSDCGSSFDSSHASADSPISRKVKKIKDISEDETDAEYVPQITRFEYEIENFGADVQQTMGSLAGKRPLIKKKRTVRDINDL
jgi:hypothetical protein